MMHHWALFLIFLLVVALPGGCAGDPARGDDGDASTAAELTFGEVRVLHGGELGARLDGEGRVLVRQGKEGWRHVLTLRADGGAVRPGVEEPVAWLRAADGMVVLAGGQETGLVIAAREGAIVNKGNGVRVALDEAGHLGRQVPGVPRVRLEGVTPATRAAALFAFTLLSLPRTPAQGTAR